MNIRLSKLVARDRMKIAFFVNAFPLVSETFILDQVVSLIRCGHDVHIYTLGWAAETSSTQHADVERYGLLERIQTQTDVNSRLARIWSVSKRAARWGWRSPETVAESLNALRYGRLAFGLFKLNEFLPAEHIDPMSYDVIHCHFGPNGQRALAWRKFGALRGPIVTTFHGYDVNKLPRIHGPDLYKTLFRNGETFTVGSEFLKRRIIALGAPENRVAKLVMGVDLSRFPFSERVKSIDGEFRLLTVARLVEVKGIEYALRALAGLREKHPEIRYQIIGDGPLRAQLEALSADLGLAKKVDFLGEMSRDVVIGKLMAAHAFILPSVVTASGEEENQSVALAEAQASGLPVIATAVGGNAETIRNGQSGFLVPPRNPEALASSIGWLAEHPEAWGPTGRAGRAHVESLFGLERSNNQLLEIYHSAIRRYFSGGGVALSVQDQSS